MIQNPSKYPHSFFLIQSQFFWYFCSAYHGHEQDVITCYTILTLDQNDLDELQNTYKRTYM